MAFELTHSIEPTKIENGIQFYWSQKKAENAKTIYQKYLDVDSVILDPFLGAGSSLYGIRNSGHKFVGVELNELPFFISSYNCKQVDETLLESLEKKFSLLKARFSEYYKFISQKNETYYFEKIIFDNLTDLKIGKIHLLKSDGSKSSSDEVPESIEIYLERHKKYKELNLELKDLELIKNSRIAIKDQMRVSEIFSPLNFHVLSLIFEEIKDDIDLKFILTSSLHLCRLTDLKSQSQFPYWVPNKNAVDRNIFAPIERKMKAMKKLTNQPKVELVNGFAELLESQGNAAVLLNKPAQEIEKEIPDSSIDLILTDPPYFDQVAYSEYLKIWEHFTGFKSHFEEEIVVSQRTQFKKDEKSYLNDLSRVFSILSKKIKGNGKMLIYFKDSRPDKMSLFINLVEDAGFSFSNQEFIHNKKYTYKQNTSKKSTLAGENILIFEKSTAIKKTLQNRTKLEAQELLENFISSYMKRNKEIVLGKLMSEGLYKFLYFEGALKCFKNINEIVSILETKYLYCEEKRSYNARK